MKSRIVELIKSNPNWRDVMTNLGIRIKEDRDLSIFNYDIDADFSNPIVREARGIIIDTDKLTVLCWPFTKFFNSHEQYAENINWNDCRVEDKIDGSIIKLWFEPAKVVLDWLTPEPQGWWRWSTNSCIDAKEANVSNTPYTFQDLIQSAINYSDIDLSSLDKSCTYIFELVSPLNQIVIKYPETKLYHIGTRNNVTGEELRVDIGIEQPRTYNIGSLEDCLEAAKQLNAKHNNVKLEGFVVVDCDWSRIKIKSPEYLELHHCWNNGNVGKEKIIDILRNTDLPIEEVCKEFPRISTQIMYYKYRMVELENNIQRYIDYARGLYEEYGYDRKAVAMTIKNHRFAAFGFEAIKQEKYSSNSNDLLNKLSNSRYCRLIADYTPIDVYI